MPLGLRVGIKNDACTIRKIWSTEKNINNSADKSLESVREFWERNPLWSGETAFAQGTREFYEEHRRIVIDDCFAGELDPRTMPSPKNSERVLDLGCGPGFWTVEIGKKINRPLSAADLTDAAIALAKSRCTIFKVEAEFSKQNAEQLSFPSSVFTHVNCQGVIHHTPDTLACVGEIARVLKPEGTASISVYYKNIVLRNWKVLSWVGKAFFVFGAKLSGRGREDIFKQNDVNEIVRIYDGGNNPIGKAYSKKEFRAMLEPHFEIEEIYFHFFPARSLPFSIPRSLHMFLDKRLPFMIYATLRKKQY